MKKKNMYNLIWIKEENEEIKMEEQKKIFYMIYIKFSRSPV